MGNWQYHIGTPLLLASTGIAIVLSRYAWHRRAVAGARPFIGMMLALAVWCFTGAMEFATTLPERKILWSMFQYVGVCAVTPFWFSFALSYSHLGAWLTRRRSVILWTLPVVILALVFTNEWHHQTWMSFRPVMGGGGTHLLVYEHGPVVWALAAYSYLLLLTGSGVVLRSLLLSRHLYRRQGAALMVAVLVPWLSNVLYLTGHVPWPGVDLTPFAFTVSGVLVAIGVFRYQLLNLVPVAHDALFEGLADGAIAVDGRGRIVDINPAAMAMLELPGGMVGRMITDLVAMRGELAPLLTAGEGSRLEVRGRKAGKTCWDEIRISLLRGNRGMIIGRLILMRDITVAKHAEDQLLETQAILKAAFEQSPAAIILIDAATHSLQIVNQAARDILGIRPGELSLPLPVRDFKATWKSYLADGTPVTSNDWPVLRAVRDGKVTYTELRRVRRQDGTDRWIVVNAAPVRGRENVITDGVMVFTDISGEKTAEEERRRLQGQLHQLQKLEGLGVLAGGIAHDYNNILMSVLGNLDLAMAELPVMTGARMYLGEARRAALKAAELTRQVMIYSGKCSFTAERIDFNKTLASMVPALRALTTGGISLQCDLSLEALPLVADVEQLRQALVNLMLNAVEAMDGRAGVIRLTSGARDCTAADLECAWLVEPAPPGRYVYVEIQDAGAGMDDATLDRLFEPFFSTKFVGRGMGLPAVLGVVRGHRGSIRITSALGRGTTVRMYLPAERMPG